MCVSGFYGALDHQSRRKMQTSLRIHRQEIALPCEEFLIGIDTPSGHTESDMANTASSCVEVSRSSKSKFVIWPEMK